MLLETKSLTRKFKRTGHGGTVIAVDNANVKVRCGETVGLFGESGSGKSTLGLMIAGLLKPSSGMLLYHNQSVSVPFKKEHRRNVQILFQHPEVSFNPALPLIKSMEEPYKIYGLPYSPEILYSDVKQFGLTQDQMHRKPSELSGGELQRAALSRILVIRPELIVLDEPTSMLDVITQAQIIEILRLNQQKNGTAYVFISHNKILCDEFCDRQYHVSNGTVSEVMEKSN